MAGLVHVVREGGDLPEEQDKFIAELGAAVERCPVAGREEPQGQAERIFADVVALHAAMAAADELLDGMQSP